MFYPFISMQLKKEEKQREKEANIAKWNAHIRECARRNRVFQIQHLDEYLDFTSINACDTIVMGKVFCSTYEMNGATHKSVEIKLFDKYGNKPPMSLPIDGYEAARVLFKIIPFFFYAENDVKRFWNDIEWNHGSSYDCDDFYDGKRYLFFDKDEEDYDSSIKTENDVMIQKDELHNLSDKALLYFSDVIECWKEDNFAEFVGDYSLWKDKRDCILSYEDDVVKELEDRGLLALDEESDTDVSDYGVQGEENVEYILKWLPKTYQVVVKSTENFDGIILRDYRISDEKQEIDHIVVGPNGVFAIETKYLKGNISVDEYGNWSREIDGIIEGVKSPIQQVDRHHMIIESILGDLINKDDIHDIICLAYDTCTVTGIDNSPVPIVKAENIGRFITSATNKRTYTDNEIQKIICRIDDYRV